MSVRRMCTRRVNLADKDETIQAAAQRLHDRRVGILVTLDRENKPIGILTDRDLAIRAVAQGHHPCPTSVGEVMTRTRRTISADVPIETGFTEFSFG